MRVEEDEIKAVFQIDMENHVPWQKVGGCPHQFAFECVSINYPVRALACTDPPTPDIQLTQSTDAFAITGNACARIPRFLWWFPRGEISALPPSHPPSFKAILGGSVNGSRRLEGFPRLQLPSEIGPNPRALPSIDQGLGPIDGSYRWAVERMIPWLQFVNLSYHKTIKSTECGLSTCVTLN